MYTYMLYILLRRPALCFNIFRGTWQCALTALGRLESSGARTWSEHPQHQHPASHKANTCHSTRGYKCDRSLDLQLRFMPAYWENFWSSGGVVGYLFPDSFMESTLWMRDARLRSEWTNEFCILFMNGRVDKHSALRKFSRSTKETLDYKCLSAFTGLNRSCFVWNDTISLSFTI